MLCHEEPRQEDVAGIISEISKKYKPNLVGGGCYIIPAVSAQSQLTCVEIYDLAFVSMIVRPFSDSVRSWPPIISTIVRRNRPLIARRTVYHCAPLQITYRTRNKPHNFACSLGVVWRLSGNAGQTQSFGQMLPIARALQRRGRDVALDGEVWLDRQKPRANESALLGTTQMTQRG